MGFSSEQQCPLCGTELSGIKYKELQSKLQREQQESAARFQQDLEKQRLSMEKKARDEAEERAKKVAFELELAAKKLKEAEAREIEVRRLAKLELAKDLEKQRLSMEKKARDEAEERAKKVASELELAAKKLTEAEAREIEVRRLAKLELAKEKIAAQAQGKKEAEQQIKQASVERDELAKQLKAAQQKEAEIRKEVEREIEKQRLAAENKARAESANQIKRLAFERDQAAGKVKEAEGRESAIRKQMTEDAEKTQLRELAKQRQALENDKKAALLKQQCESNRKIESIQKKMQQVERQLQNKTANELGDGPEIDLFESLREHFPTDKITRVPKGTAGADIIFEALYKGVPCGRIIVESKNRQDWKAEYVTKLRQDQIEASAEHAILATRFFPRGEKEMCIESDVIVISPARVIYVAQLLRRAMETMHIKGLSMKERSTKMSRLYNLINSDFYKQKFSEATRLAEEILEVDVQEKKAHDNIWKRRGSLTKQVQNALREVETEVAAVIEGVDDLEAPLAFGVRSAHALPLSQRAQDSR